MRLSLYVQFTLKDRPKGYRGLTGDSWNFGKERKVSLCGMCMMVLEKIFDWYGIFEDADELNRETKLLARW